MDDEKWLIIGLLLGFVTGVLTAKYLLGKVGIRYEYDDKNRLVTVLPIPIPE